MQSFEQKRENAKNAGSDPVTYHTPSRIHDCFIFSLESTNVSGLSTRTLTARSRVLSARKRMQSFVLSASAVPLDHDGDYDG